jgi:outer membrane protein assembly factor BamA
MIFGDRQKDEIWGRRVSAVKAAVFLTVLLTVCARLTAQSPESASARLASVEVVGSARFSSEKIAPVTGLRIGSDVTRDDLQSAANRLAKIGLFKSVQYRFTTGEGGVYVNYQLMDLPAFPVSFDNFPWFTDEEITSALKTSVPLFDGSAPAQGAILDEISAALGKLLEMRDIRATVSHKLEGLPDGTQVQQFQAEGADLKIGSVEFSDTLANSDRGVQTRVSDVVGKPFSRGAVKTFELEQVRPIYLSKGYLRVRFEEPNARFVGGVNSSLPNKIVVVAPVEPGDMYMWSGIKWSGNSAIQTDELDQLAKLKASDPADGMKIEAMWQDVRNAYAKRGYLDAMLDPIPHFDEASKRVAYTVEIKEGPQYQMGTLILSGLSPEGEKRIRANWKLPHGTLFDKSVYDQFIDTGISQAFAGLPYHYDKVGKFLQQNPETGKVDVLIDFQ